MRTHTRDNRPDRVDNQLWLVKLDVVPASTRDHMTSPRHQVNKLL